MALVVVMPTSTVTYIVLQGSLNSTAKRAKSHYEDATCIIKVSLHSFSKIQTRTSESR